MTPSAGLRRVLHATTALALLVGFRFSWAEARLVLTAFAALMVTVELFRLTLPSVNVALARWLPVFRSTERNRPSGGLWLAMGLAVAAWFAFPAAAVGVWAGALADPAGSWVSTGLGGSAAVDVTGTKTLRGSLGVAFVAAVGAAVYAFPAAPAAAIGLLGGAIERWSAPFNDNLLLAPGVAIGALLMG